MSDEPITREALQRARWKPLKDEDGTLQGYWLPLCLWTWDDDSPGDYTPHLLIEWEGNSLVVALIVARYRHEVREAHTMADIETLHRLLRQT